MTAPDYSPLGRLLRERRLRAGLSQETLAELAGVPRDTISAIERGRIQIPSPAILNRLAPALANVTVAELLAAIGYHVERATDPATRRQIERAALEAVIAAACRLLDHEP